MDELLRKLFCRNIWIMVMLPLASDRAERDSLCWTVLQAAKALKTVCTDGSSTVLKLYIAARTELNTLTAADTTVRNLKARCLFPQHDAKALVFDNVQEIAWRLFFNLFRSKISPAISQASISLLACAFSASMGGIIIV